jgi:UDP:flavonoid glycosyltransferase YjiC (YdhE family)
LQAFPSIELLLRGLMAQNARSVLFVRNLPEAMRQAYSDTGLVFVDAPVDLQMVAKQADWAISHGNHSTAAHFAASGVPQLLIPLYQEQLFLAQKLYAQGSAVLAFQDQPGFTAPLCALAMDTGYRQRAAQLAKQCGRYDTQAVSDAIRQEFDLLLRGAM